MPDIQIKGLVKQFGVTQVLKGLDLDVRDGDVSAVLDIYNHYIYVDYNPHEYVNHHVFKYNDSHWFVHKHLC